MKVHFNHFERVAGLFVIVAFVGMIFSLVTVAAKQGWFDAKVDLVTEFENAEGVHSGTGVQIAGLRAGSVDEVELTGDNHIIVRFHVLSKFQDKIRFDSQASLIRPFIIGERVLDISPGSAHAAKINNGDRLAGLESTDLMTMLSGRSVGQYLETFSHLMAEVHHIAEALLSQGSSDDMVKTIQSLGPLVHNLNSMSLEVVKLSHGLNKDERLVDVIKELSTTTKELNQMLPGFREQAPQLAKDVNTLVGNLADLTTQFRVLTPVLAEFGPQLPRVTKRAVEALDEAVVLMKGIEKSWLVRSNVKEVREEEQQQRSPSSNSGK